IRGVDVQQRNLRKIEVLQVGESADNQTTVAVLDRLELAGGKAVLRNGVDGRGAADRGKLGQTTRADIDGDVAKRLATDGHIRDCNRRPRRAGERAARAESKGRADVNPLGLDACRGRVGL